ncbi:hypothetical protein BDW59DRAFT_181876 [Aspergillus cavernicola]|uniref:Uncharacterized protein n=1 Tax=Aspergillus cavernicola TaxID=176166 RepID=A0ABR4HTC3_9EURO
MQPRGANIPGLGRMCWEYVPLTTFNQTTATDHDEPQNEWPRPAQTKRNIWERISTITILIICLDFVLLIIPCVLPGTMWRELIIAISGEEPNMLWIQIVHANWTSSLVTVCTAVIRTLMALQASLFTAMVGGIVLEKISTSLSHAPFYSIIRAVSVSLSSLLFTASIQPRSLLALLVSLLLIAEVLLTVVSQFLSTILISDFRNSAFTDTNNSTNVAFMGGWKMPPASNWMFGELSDPFLEGSYFHDTGHTYRALLSYEDESQRIFLRRFYGPAPVIDHRVVCVSPSVTDITLNATAEWMVQMEDPLVNPTFNDSIPVSLSQFYRNPKAAAIFMVLETIEPSAIYSPTQPLETNVTVVRRDSPWAIVNNGRDTEGLQPKLSWVRDTLRYNTGSSQRQLAASMSPESLRNRGLLELQPKSQWRDFDKWSKHWCGLFLSESSFLMRMKDADRTHVDLFYTILRSTKSPALALQALLTRGTRMLFYHNLIQFNNTQLVLTKFSSITSLPARWTGFIAGMSIIASHFIVLAAIIPLFIYTKSSLIGNYWHAVSQVVSEDTLPALDQEYATKDEEVKRWGKGQIPRLAHQSLIRLRPNGWIALGIEEKAG